MVRGGQRVGLARCGPERARRARSRATRSTHGSYCVIQLPDAIAEPDRDDLDVLRERLGRLARRPAAAVLERLREVPVVERHERLDARGEQLVDEAVVEVEARRRSRGPRPSGRIRGHAIEKRKAFEPELADQADVLAVAVVRVAGDRAAVPSRPSRARAEAIPDALAATVLVGAPSTWYAAVAAPQTKSGRKIVRSLWAVSCVTEPVKDHTRVDRPRARRRPPECPSRERAESRSGTSPSGPASRRAQSPTR